VRTSSREEREEEEEEEKKEVKRSLMAFSDHSKGW